MSFNTLNFMAFFALFLVLYYVLPRKAQTFLLLVGNYVFYLFSGILPAALLLAGTLLSWLCGKAIEHSFLGRRKLWLALGQGYTLGLLFLLKYLGFFVNTATGLLGFGAVALPAMVVPVGISFFTFSVSGYLFDVYAGKLKAEENFVRFGAFVAFFPAILAGPVGKAREFLPQLNSPRSWDTTRIKAGFLRFVLGCVKKMALADLLGISVDKVFSSPDAYSGGMWLLTSVLYALQIFWDFSAYSDMALGIAQMLGFRLTENFRHPYISRSVKEFWKGWHISLTSWFREYLYFPLGGSRCSKARCWFNILVVFAVSGLWHGAAGSFIIWGLLNGLYQVAGQITEPYRRRIRQGLRISDRNPLLILWQMFFTFGLITASWMFFRAESVSQAIFIIKRVALIARYGFGEMNLYTLGFNYKGLHYLEAMVSLFLVHGIYDYLRPNRKGLEHTVLPYWLTIVILLLVLSLLGVYGEGFDPQEFVYFKF